MMDSSAYRAILDSINSPIVFVDNEHRIQHLNKAARFRYYEIRGYSNLVGESLFNCHSPASQEMIKDIHARLLEGEDEIFLKINKDGEKITVVSVRDPDGEMIGYYERFEPAPETAKCGQ
ncbi:MAG: PAS domain-containing protein [Desulfovermiculus sp.]